MLKDEVLKSVLDIDNMQEVERAPRGFSVRCKANFETIENLNNNIEIGVFTEEIIDKLSDLLTRLTGLIGTRARIEAYCFFSDTLRKPWPKTEDGIPAYLEGFVVIFHDGNGKRFLVGGKDDYD